MTIELNAAAKKLRFLPWGKIKQEILGKRFQLSVALLPPQEMRRVRRILRLEKKYRFEPHHAVNVISFLLSPHAGEILLNKDQIRRESRVKKESFRNHLLFLYIHGLLHLKGHDHKKERDAANMEERERKLFARFIKIAGSKRATYSIKRYH